MILTGTKWEPWKVISNNKRWKIRDTEIVVKRRSVKKMLLKSSQNRKWRLQPHLKKRFWHRCFPVNFAKFCEEQYLKNICHRLLLEVTTRTHSNESLPRKSPKKCDLNSWKEPLRKADQRISTVWRVSGNIVYDVK